MTKEEIKKEIAECEERLKAEQERLAALHEELDKPEYGGKRWKPKRGELYYILFADGRIGTYHRNSNYDADVWAHGNCFKTGEEAEFEAERRKVIAELSDFSEGDDAVWDVNGKHYYLYYSHSCGVMDIGCTLTAQCGELYFPSKEAAKAAVKTVGEERVKKYYLGIKEVWLLGVTDPGEENEEKGDEGDNE